MNFIVKRVENHKIDEALNMVMDVFNEFNGPDYGKMGIETFKRSIIESNIFRNRLVTGDQVMYVAYHEDILIGVIAISARNHISLLFVHRNYHNLGVATNLFNTLLKELKFKKGVTIKLNSSPYAIEFYKKLGFVTTDKEQAKGGIIYTPMEYNV
ncbi:MAG: GNAT family N-acetyltransferase [Peptostreptococcaceae bacterium]